MLSIIIPTYNERDTVFLLIEQIAKVLDGVCEYELLFVDDSVDDTPAILEKASTQNLHVRYIHREEKAGLASAVACGFKNARGDILAVMDADLQHPPALLADMLYFVENGADIVLPSRYIAGGGSEGLSPVRALASKFARLTGQIFLQAMRRVSDPMSGFFMMRASVIEGVELQPIGWKILMEVLVLGHYSAVAEIPYGFEKRVAGESKLSLKITAQYFMHILSLIFRSEADRSFYLFVLVGLSGLLIDMLAFSLLHSQLGLPLNLAATLSGCFAIITNYILNRNFTWKGRSAERATAEFVRYALVCALGIGLKNGIVFLVSMTGLAGFLCNLLGIACSSISNYLLSSRWVFPKKSGRIRYTVVEKIKERTFGR